MSMCSSESEPAASHVPWDGMERTIAAFEFSCQSSMIGDVPFCCLLACLWEIGPGRHGRLLDAGCRGKHEKVSSLIVVDETC